MDLNHMENMVEFNKTNPRYHQHTIAFDGIVSMSFLETSDHVFHFVESNMTKITRVCEASFIFVRRSPQMESTRPKHGDFKTENELVKYARL